MTLSTERSKAMLAAKGCYCPAPMPNAHPVVHFLWAQMRIEGMSRRELQRRAGLSPNTMRGWWYPALKVGRRQYHGGIDLNNLEAALGVFGYTLKPTPKRED